MTHMLHGIDIAPLLKAQAIFERFCQHLESDQEKAGAVQAFEFCYELAWKTMKRFLDKKGVEVRSPRDAFREAALNGFIADPKKWFVFIEKRNITTQIYDEKILENIVAIFGDFSKELSSFIDFLKDEAQIKRYTTPAIGYNPGQGGVTVC